MHESSGATLGHQRLSIIDLSTGHQALVSADGRYVIVYNGEIYNYLELRDAPGRDGVAFRTASDTEVLLELLVREGAAGLRRLNGMFAFVLLDTVEDRWLMARDPIGIKPLYFAALQTSWFSVRRPRFAHPGYAPSSTGKDCRSTSRSSSALTTALCSAGSARSSPAATLKAREEASFEQCATGTPAQCDERRTEAQFIETLRDLLDDTLRLQVRSDVPREPISGSLDSTVVASAAAPSCAGLSRSSMAALLKVGNMTSPLPALPLGPQARSLSRSP
jgi:asparagine synthase (glutamine-hydrolysing)